jgi:SpoU rRNA methylase family enzyme
VRLFADTCTGFGIKNIIFSKITASAASMGIPEAQKSILKSGGNMLFFSDIIDILETFSPNKIYLLVARKYGKRAIPFSQISEEMKNEKVLIVVGGTSPGLTRKELDLGECIFANEILHEINPIALTTLFLTGIIKSQA